MHKSFFPYLAGYIDGDGHFRFRKYIQSGYTCFNCKLMITSTNAEPLKYFCENIGGTFYAKARSNPNWKQEFIYTLHIGKETFTKIMPLKRFLIEKKSQFEFIEKYLNGDKSIKQDICINILEERMIGSVNFQKFESLKGQSKICELSKNDIFYLCGYIDAECCLTVTKKTLKPTGSKSFSCHMRASSTHFPCIQFLFNKLGGCIHYRKSVLKNRSDCIQWELTDKSLEPILEKIFPYLIVKKRQCEELISLRKTFLQKKHPRDKDFISYYNHSTPIRECIYSTVKALNKRGS